MKQYVAGLAAQCFFSMLVVNLGAASPEFEHAREYGAKGKVTLRVVNSGGKIVKDADINGALFRSDSHDKDDIFDKSTDTNGLCVVEGISVDQMTYTITKAGHYKTEGQYWFYPGPGRSMDRGRWQPWNPTNPVTLKERRNPVPMYAKNVDIPVPVRDVPVGFDLEVGDWVAPHGKGKEADLLFTYKAQIQDPWTGFSELRLACSNELGGFFRTAKDSGSEFHSAYEAPTNGYQTAVVLSLDRTKFKMLKKELFADTEYLIFRVRPIVDDKGNVISVQYGKIYGPIDFGVGKDHRVRFTYYFNPTPNDRNLEFDPGRNLLVSPGRTRVNMP